MKRWNVTLGSAALLGCLSLFFLAASPAGAVYQVGDHVSDFTLPDGQGNMVSLYDYQDRIVLLAFWFYT